MSKFSRGLCVNFRAAIMNFGACSPVHGLVSHPCSVHKFSRNDLPALAYRDARLYVTGNGQGSPCLDLRRVPDTLADATVGTDLVIVEGMGRAIHTNYKYACPLVSWLAYLSNLTWRMQL